MEPWQLALVLKPIGLFIVLAALYYGVRRPIQRRMKEGKLKRFLLFKLN